MFAAGAIFYSWRRRDVAPRNASPTKRQWSAWGVRLALFTLVFFCLAYVIQAASDQKWVGMASALPLPGLFALAALSMQGEGQVLAIRDTVLLGPVFVVPFNWLFALLATSLPAGNKGQLIGSVALVAALSLALGCIYYLLPILERYLDGRSSSCDQTDYGTFRASH
jgi:hypothetical protein